MFMLMDETVLVILDAAVVCILYHADDKCDLFKCTLNFFLMVNSKILGVEDVKKEEIRKFIRGGESK